MLADRLDLDGYIMLISALSLRVEVQTPLCGPDSLARAAAQPTEQFSFSLIFYDLKLF